MEYVIALMHLLQTIVFPWMIVAIVVGGCAADSRPKKKHSSKSKSKKHRSKKRHSRSSKSGIRKRKSHSRSSKSMGKGKRKSKSGSKSMSASGISASSSKSKSKGSHSKDSRRKKASTSDSFRNTNSGTRSGSDGRRAMKQEKKNSLIDLPDRKSRASEEAVDSRAISRPIGGQSQKEMMMEPAELRWSPTGGIQKVLITNATDECRAIKVKCSDNNLYRVNPVYSFVEPGQSLGIDIVRQNGGPKIDKMVFVTAKAESRDVHPREMFTPGVAHPMMVLPLIAV